MLFPSFAHISKTVCIVGAAALLGAATANAGTVSPYQSSARPFGAELANEVQLNGSDERAAEFEADVLPLVVSIANEKLSEQVEVNEVAALELDPSVMVVSESIIPRIYFVSEGAGFHNSLLAQVIHEDDTLGDSTIIFPNASSSVSALNTFQGDPVRSDSAPLLAGDFVDLDVTLEAGDRLSLHIVANGAKGGSNMYSTEAELNDDGLDQHVVTLALPEESASKYVVMGFEDLWGGGDRDFNDLVIAIDFGEANVEQFLQEAPGVPSVPLPAPILGLGTALFAMFGLRRRTKVKSA